MTNQPTPRRMKANPDKPFGHEVEHAWERDCDDIVPKCLPVDAPEPRILTKDFAVSTPTPPPASAPDSDNLRSVETVQPVTNARSVESNATPTAPEGTPVERWLTHDEIFDIKFPFTAELKVRRIIERLCALLDDCEGKGKLAADLLGLTRDERDQLKADLAAAREALERISNDQPNGPTIARETLGKLKGTPMKTEHTKEPITTVDNEWKAKAERLESILTCTEKPLPPGCARTRYALEEKLVKATDLLKLAVDRLEQAYVASEQHLGATPARSWEVAANGVRKFREGIASLDARAALAATKEGA